MIIDLHIVGAFAILWAAIVPTPGANSLMVTHVALSFGFRTAAIAICGNIVGTAILALSALLGLSAVLELVPWSRLAVGVAGGLYLVWVGVRLIRRSWAAPATPLADVASDEPPMPAGKALGLGFATALSNGQAIFFITSIFSAAGLLGANLATGFASVGTLLVMNAIWLLMLAGLFQHAHARGGYLRLRRSIEAFMGGLFLFFGGRLLVREIARFIATTAVR